MTVVGDGFTPNSNIQIIADDLAGRTVPLAIGISSTDVTGHFPPNITQQWCWPNQINPAIIQALDDFGQTAAGTSDAYVC